MTSAKHSRKHSNYGSCIESHRPLGRYGGTVSTASIAWVAACLLKLSQPGTGVCAFTHSQKTCGVPNAHTKRVKPGFQPRCPSYLNYRNIESQPLKDRFQQYHMEIFQLPNITNDRWKTPVHGQINEDRHSSSEIYQQSIVDEYLESIDRRYKRVHQSDTKDDRSYRGFTSAWAWLTADKSSLIEEEKQRNEENALCVFGLAKLASVRLLQKHHLPVNQSHQLSSMGDNPVIIDVRGENDSTTTLSIRDILTAKFARFLNSMQKAYTYRCAVMSLQQRAGFYHTLKHRISTFTQFLAALILTCRCMVGSRFIFQFAFMVACAVVVIRPFKV